MLLKLVLPQSDALREEALKEPIWVGILRSLYLQHSPDWGAGRRMDLEGPLALLGRTG